MKKWITLIASALLVGVASWAIAAESQFGAPQRRAQRKARPAKRAPLSKGMRLRSVSPSRRATVSSTA